MKGLVARTEALFRHVVRAVKGALAVEITPKVSSAEEPHARKAVILDFSKPFARVHVLKAIFEKTGLSVDVFDKNLEITLRTLCTRQSIAFKASDSRIQLFDGLVSSLIEPSCVQPTFLVGFPSFMSPLACDSPSEPGISERFEFFVNGMELCNAYTELGDPMKQRQKFMEYEELQNRESSNHVAMNEEFCKALEYGLPPTVGWGMGIDRLTMLLTNSSSIREVISFPTLDYESLGYQQKQQ
jgi:lysyl-tRNA synthetase class 2